MQDILQQLSPILGNPALWLAVTLVAFIFGQHLYKLTQFKASAVPHEENTDSHWEKQYWLGVRLGLAAMVFLTLAVGAVLYIRRNRGRAVHRKGGRYVRK